MRRAGGCQHKVGIGKPIPRDRFAAPQIKGRGKIGAVADQRVEFAVFATGIDALGQAI